MKATILTLLIALTALSAKAQTDAATPFILGETRTLYSNELAENRTLNIYLPDGYAKDTAHYPVIYLLDGSADEDFIHIAGLVQFFNMLGIMPKMIVVGIANVDRKRDFTYPSSLAADKKLVPTSGGSARFIAFLEKDLQPYIEQHYRTGTKRTLIGQSLGGLVATEILLKKPALFTNYIIVSPSLWWDKESLLAKAPALLQQQPEGSRKVYICVGSEGKQMEGDAKKLVQLLQAQKSLHSKLKISFAPLPAENHLTILHQCVNNGFKAKAAE